MTAASSRNSHRFVHHLAYRSFSYCGFGASGRPSAVRASSSTEGREVVVAFKSQTPYGGFLAEMGHPHSPQTRKDCWQYGVLSFAVWDGYRESMTIRKGWDDLVSPERKAFAAKLRARRKELSLTQVNLSERTGLAVSHISNLEKAEANPSLEVMVSLARALDVNIVYFFGTD